MTGQSRCRETKIGHTPRTQPDEPATLLDIRLDRPNPAVGMHTLIGHSVSNRVYNILVLQDECSIDMTYNISRKAALTQDGN